MSYSYIRYCVCIFVQTNTLIIPIMIGIIRGQTDNRVIITISRLLHFDITRTKQAKAWVPNLSLRRLLQGSAVEVLLHEQVLRRCKGKQMWMWKAKKEARLKEDLLQKFRAKGNVIYILGYFFFYSLYIFGFNIVWIVRIPRIFYSFPFFPLTLPLSFL